MTAARRLAAILAVDVVGYSRLMGEDEAGTAERVRERREAARPIVAGHGGRVVKTMGDGLLLEFPSVVAAAECAIAIQKLMAERNAETPEAERIVYRIGVNLGDVLIDADFLGEGVNIAARLAQRGRIRHASIVLRIFRISAILPFPIIEQKMVRSGDNSYLPVPGTFRQAWPS